MLAVLKRNVKVMVCTVLESGEQLFLMKNLSSAYVFS